MTTPTQKQLTVVPALPDDLAVEQAVNAARHAAQQARAQLAEHSVDPAVRADAAAAQAVFDQRRDRLRDASAVTIHETIAIDFRDSFTHTSYLKRTLPGLVVDLDYLSQFPGATWAERWFNGGCDTAWDEFAELESTHAWKSRSNKRRGLEALLCLRLIQPSYAFLFHPGHAELVKDVVAVSEPLWQSKIRAAAMHAGGSNQTTANLLRDISRLCVRTGKTVGSLAVVDFVDVYAALEELTRENRVARASDPQNVSHRQYPSYAVPFKILRSLDVLPTKPATLRAATTATRPEVDELVSRIGIQSSIGRAMITRYLQSRESEGLDYTSLESIADNVGRIWWFRMERVAGRPIETFAIPDDIAARWRFDLTETPTRFGEKRKSVLKVKSDVRRFYKWLNEQAEAEPHIYAEWACRCFITAIEMRGAAKQRAKTKAALDAHIRTLLPQQRALRDFLTQDLLAKQALLAATGETPIAETFTVDGQAWVRAAPGNLADSVRAHREGQPSKIVDVEILEDDAFWAWAIVEGFCIVGVRIEELLELTTFDFIPLDLPDGRQIPLLHINASKSDRERLIPLLSEEVAVFAAIKRRITRPDGTIDSCTRYDEHEHEYTDELPYLFQRRDGMRSVSPASASVRNIIKRAIVRSGITYRGKPLQVRPHDLRRLFVTNRLDEGMPIEVVAAIVGHRKLDTTAGYNTITHRRVVESYLRYTTKKREQRPATEHTVDSATAQQAMAAFQEKFEGRRTSLGPCMRGWGDDCTRQHNCSRCPLVDLASVA